MFQGIHLKFNMIWAIYRCLTSIFWPFWVRIRFLFTTFWDDRSRRERSLVKFPHGFQCVLNCIEFQHKLTSLQLSNIVCSVSKKTAHRLELVSNSLAVSHLYACFGREELHYCNDDVQKTSAQGDELRRWIWICQGDNCLQYIEDHTLILSPKTSKKAKSSSK